MIQFSVKNLDSCPSTNDLVLDRIRSGEAAAGEVWVAREQPGARGRVGRRWMAEEGGLWMTATLPLLAGSVGWAGMLAALAVCRALDDVGLQAGVKWPNDVVVERKKLAGILVETVAGRELAAVGIGLNVRNRLPSSVRCQGGHRREAVVLVEGQAGGENGAPALLWPATSVAREMGREMEPQALLEPVLHQLSELWARWEAGRWEELLAAWAERDACRGLCVQLLPDGPRGIAEGVDATGALRVRLADGTLHLARAGELIFVE